MRSLAEPIAELGSTVDDAAGEAYDKVARLLGLGYPGGKVLDDLAREGDRDAIVFPRGMTGPRDDPYAFSFSGLKTAVARYVERHPDAPQADVAAGFQEAVADVLTMKAVRAATELGVSTLLIAGGVAANSRLRELAEERCAANGLTLRIPRPRLCTDNGAMIASFAAHLVAAGAPPSAAGRRQRSGTAGGERTSHMSELARPTRGHRAAVPLRRTHRRRRLRRGRAAAGPVDVRRVRFAGRSRAPTTSPNCSR